jgi:uncharacterized protein YeaO (DUF488 family)
MTAKITSSIQSFINRNIRNFIKNAMPVIVLKRVYETPSPEDGCRILVDRLWPRGLSKEDADIDEWDKELAPSSELRTWFHHDPELWNDFSERYLKELQQSNLGKSFMERHKNQEKITLVYAAKDQEHCHPIILKQYLESW